MITYRTGVSGIAAVYTVGIGYFCLVVVTECINGYSLSRDLRAAYCTVNYAIVRALVLTIGSLFVLYGRSTCGVTECIGLVCNVAMITYRTGVSGIAAVYTVGCSYYCIVLVTKCIYGCGYSGNFRIAYGTVNYSIVRACVYTIGCNVILDYSLACGVTKCIYGYGLSRDLRIAYGTVNYCLVRALVYAIGCNIILDYCLACGVTKCCSLVSNVLVATYGTGVGGVTAGYTIGCSYYCIVLVTKRVYGYGLSGELLAAYRAVNYGIVRACLITGGINVILGYRLTCGVTGSVYSYVLSRKLCATYGAVNYRVVRTCVIAIGSNVVLYYRCTIGVTEHRSNFLLDLIIALGAVLAFGKTGGGTSSTYCRILNDAVSECLGLVCNVGVATYGTSVGGVTAVYTIGCSYYCIVLVTTCGNLIANVAVLTSGAGVGSVTAVYTVGCGYYRYVRVKTYPRVVKNVVVLEVLVLILFKRRNLVRNVAVATGRTGIGGITACLVGRLGYYCVILMTVSLGLAVNVAVTACRTSVGGVTTGRTGRIGYYCFVIVTESLGLVCNVAVAARTGVGGITAVLTVGIGYYCFVIVTESIDLVCNVAVATYRAGVGGVAAVLTIGIGYYCVVLVTERRIEHVAANRTGLGFVTGSLSTGSMSLCANLNRLYANHVTISTFLASGASGRCTGRSLCRNFHKLVVASPTVADGIIIVEVTIGHC